MFHPGQKVICIDAKKMFMSDPDSGLIEGRIYTIVNEFVDILDDMSGVTLEEIEPPDGFPGWLAIRFRPAVDRKTDISIFISMLTPEKVDA